MIQTDQGTNFTSRTFSQVLKLLRIKHNVSVAYHPESQGALERFHQTLKSMLRAYCFELERDWEEGVPWLLFASREVVQESLGFSPAELVFGHTPRGPLTVLKEKWLCDSKCGILPEYVTKFRTRLYRARELAKQNLEKTQNKMKTWFDKKAREWIFSPGDKVLVLLPVPGGSLQARYSGPYVVEKKLSDRDYVIHTPDAFLNYKVMAFGMKNAPRTFQRRVNKVLAGVPGCEAYLDDLVLYSSSWAEHLSFAPASFLPADRSRPNGQFGQM